MTSIAVGTKLGRYEIRSEVGQGGMSVVYQAWDTQLRRDVAIKVMHAFLAEQTEARERFYREAVAVARLRHPNIIEIYDYSAENAERSFIVAEFVDGPSLSTWLGTRTVRPPEASLALMRPLVEAIGHAHAAGVVHRDLKPENVLVAPGGVLKLTDFGIARMLDNQTLTVTGTLLGSPAYMAPEYIEGEPTDARADIFSFGAMLYQVITGTLPFCAPSPHALLKRIASEAHVPANQLNPKVHGTLARILDRCLQKKPQNRYRDADALLADIDAALARAEIDADEVRTRLLSVSPNLEAALEPVLANCYFEQGNTALKTGRTGLALEDFDRVLSIVPDHTGVRRLLKGIHRRALGRRIGIRAGATAAVAMLIALGATFWSEIPESPPVPAVDPPQVAPAPVAPPERKRDVTFLLQGTGTLSVDDAVVAEGVTGAVPYQLLPGSHVARFQTPDKTVEQRFEVPTDDDVPPAPVQLDGSTPVEPAPEDTPEPASPPAPVPIKQVSFIAGQVMQVYVDDRTTPQEAQQGLIRHTTLQQGRFTLELPHGRHRLRFESPYHKPQTLEVEVSNTEPPERMKIDLELRDGQLLVRGAPQGLVEVAIDGTEPRFISDANRNDPIMVPLTRGQLERDVVVTKEGFEPFRTRVRFRPGALTEVAVNLRPKS